MNIPIIRNVANGLFTSSSLPIKPKLESEKTSDSKPVEKKDRGTIKPPPGRVAVTDVLEIQGTAIDFVAENSTEQNNTKEFFA